MSEEGSITKWFGSLQAGNHAAAQGIWQRFAGRLIGLARARLHTAPRRVADEEDAVLSAFDSFCRGAEQGRFPQLGNRYDLWNLLVAITLRKVSDQIQRERRKKRGAGGVICEADLQVDDAADLLLENIIGMEPTPEMVVEMTEQCRLLLDSLPDVELRNIALWKMEGYTNEEIAQKLDCARSTVQRKLLLIQARWEQHVA